MNAYFIVKRVMKLFALLLIVQLSGCGSPQVTPLAETDTVVAFGDSLTAGYGVSKKESYPSVLASISGLKVVNEGISGETTTQGLKRLPSVLEKHNPKLVILLEGGNDVLRNVKPPLIEANLKKMIQMIHQSGADVLLLGVPEKKLFSSSLPLYSDLADELQLPLDDSIIASLMRRPSMKSDYVHFNASGYRELAEAVYELMLDSGAIES